MSSLAQAFAAQDMSVGAQMPRYRCHKEVYALKIKSIELAPHPTIAELDKILHGEDVPSLAGAYIQPEDSGYGVFTVSRAFVAKHEPKAGGYFVVYDDGYQSFSPAKAFEEGYTRI